jgi:flagellar assembly protein FliH
MLDKKFRVNAPDGWEEKEAIEKAENEARETAEREAEVQRLLDLQMADVAELRERELKNLEVMKENMMDKAHKESDKVVKDAQNERKRLVREAIEQAENEREKIREEAHQAGFTDGVAAGMSEGSRLTAEAERILDEAHKTRREMMDNLEPDLLDLIVGITEKLLYKKAVFDPKMILHLIRAGFAEITSTDSSDEISVLVSDTDYETVVENREELLKIVGGGTKLEIVRDPSLSKSDCVIKTAFGYIDTSLALSMEELKENLYLIGNGEPIG